MSVKNLSSVQALSNDNISVQDDEAIPAQQSLIEISPSTAELNAYSNPSSSLFKVNHMKSNNDSKLNN